eukprot:jgi/Botrbrau1/23191/Bobra.0041s0038.1
MALLRALVCLPLVFNILSACVASGTILPLKCQELEINDCLTKSSCMLCRSKASGKAACYGVAEPFSDDRFCQLSASKCDNLPQAQCTQSGCAWCSSAAVGASCYTKEDAKKLPSSIFSCTGVSVRPFLAMY